PAPRRAAGPAASVLPQGEGLRAEGGVVVRPGPAAPRDARDPQARRVGPRAGHPRLPREAPRRQPRRRRDRDLPDDRPGASGAGKVVVTTEGAEGADTWSPKRQRGKHLLPVLHSFGEVPT